MRFGFAALSVGHGDVCIIYGLPEPKYLGAYAVLRKTCLADKLFTPMTSVPELVRVRLVGGTNARVTRGI